MRAPIPLRRLADAPAVLVDGDHRPTQPIAQRTPEEVRLARRLARIVHDAERVPLPLPLLALAAAAPTGEAERRAYLTRARTRRGVVRLRVRVVVAASCSLLSKSGLVTSLYRCLQGLTYPT